MENWRFYLERCLSSIEKQTFKDYEIILTKAGTMPNNSNRSIESAKGELVKILYMDDYFKDDDSLSKIISAFGENDFWLVTGCLHNDGYEVKNHHTPEYTDDIYTGNNCIGSPSVLTMRREGALLFDTRLSWLLDCDLYKRLHDKYGPPVVIKSPNVVIGIHSGQTSNLMSTEEKQKEHEYLIKKYET